MNEPRLTLKDCDFSKADLEGDLHNIDFTRSTFEGANIYDCNLSGCDFQGANLKNASFRNVNLQGVNLRGAKLDGIHLYSVIGIRRFGPIGVHGGKMWTAVDWGDKIMFHTKNFWGTEEEAIEFIDSEYRGTPTCDLYKNQIKLVSTIMEEERRYY